ncbi:MAG: hypothetical protein A3D92_08960 [Bacteroidetes bacterium RIFCSPHIGHO2_02_FULL_44_7]|nr:MAG: hypothetical protein A3D92_08960 [Bacteroidetes bacterium RIFCSPHIGHO2_02_FULL_44_7]
MYDQLIRDKTGGMMSASIQEGYYDPDYGRKRFRDVFDEFVPAPSSETKALASKRKNFPERLRGLTVSKFMGRLKKKTQTLLYRSRFKKMESFLGNDPRKTFELNKWFYDRLSLRLLLESAGFIDYKVQSYNQSDILGWERYQLDKSNFGDYPVEPSLYVEAQKPHL